MTYPEIAAHYEVAWWPEGWDGRENVRVTRSGLRKFLMDIWRFKQTRYHEPWEALWLANRFAYHEAMHTWHRRIPTWHFDTDRAKVAWYLSQSRPNNDAKQRKQAARWAENRT